MPPQQPREQCCRVEDSFVPSIGFRIEDSRVEGQGLFPKQKQHGNTVGSYSQNKRELVIRVPMRPEWSGPGLFGH